MERIVNAAHGGQERARKAAKLIQQKRKQEEEDGEKRSGPTLSESLVEVVKKRYSRAQGKSSLSESLKNNTALRKEIVESRLPADLLPENRTIPIVPYSGTVGEFIPRPLEISRLLKNKASLRKMSLTGGSQMSSPHGSPHGSPRGGGGRSSSLSSLFDTETHVGGVLTFFGRTKEVRFFFDGCCCGFAAAVCFTAAVVLLLLWFCCCGFAALFLLLCFFFFLCNRLFSPHKFLI